MATEMLIFLAMCSAYSPKELIQLFGPIHPSVIRYVQVKYGGGILGMSGSIGGQTHARNRFGAYIRARTKPVNPNSERQTAVRAIMAYLAEFWHDELDATERGLWDTYAAAITMKNRLGENIHLTGFNHFIRYNCVRITSGGGATTTAPSILSLPEKDPELVCSEEDIAGQTFTFTCDVDGWVVNGDYKSKILIYQGQPKLASRTFFGGPWRYMDYIDNTEGQAGTATLAASFAFAEGQKVWFQARVQTLEYRVSELWTLAPRTILAD